MPSNIEQLCDLIAKLEVPQEQKEALLSQVGVIQQDLKKSAFKLQRIEKDKEIMANLLNSSIQDLQQNQLIAEERNGILQEQKEEIESKNGILKNQKKRIQEQSAKLQEHLSKLEMSYREMEQFTYIASHDLKSPLRTIANFAQLLEKRHRAQLNSEAIEFIDFIVSGAQRMDRVICDLLEYSRVGNRDKTMDWVDLNKVLELVQLNLKMGIEENQATIESGTLPDLWVNRSGMIQLFQNLVANAIKFRRSVSPHIMVSCEQDGDVWTFSFRDNGVGIEQEFHNKAFLPFQRLGNLDVPGMGMGLAICKKVVKLHRGDIWYESEFGEGTTFFFTLSQHKIKRYSELNSDLLAN